MKEFRRSNAYLSLCGLNCGLCSMHISGHCPGCGCGPHHSCAIVKCSLEHNHVENCFECNKFPCTKYEGADTYDSFITHQGQFQDIYKAKSIGIEAYTREQKEKVDILLNLLEHYNAGRQKSFFCIAVNLLELSDIRKIMVRIVSHSENNILSRKEKAAYAVNQFQVVADEQGIKLKLRKKSLLSLK